MEDKTSKWLMDPETGLWPIRTVGIGGDYTTLTSWHAAMPANITSSMIGELVDGEEVRG